MRSLIDFINHGLFPFTGRDIELHRIVEFWRGSGEAPGLQALLLMGEAGVGKSRLIEEAIAEIVKGGGGVIQTKLYPESPAAIVPLLARALWRFGSLHPNLKIEPEEKAGSVIASLRRLARLRPTIVVIEDIHLFTFENIADVSTILSALADEQIALLCAARPQDLVVRGVLERYIIDEIELSGWNSESMAELLASVLGGGIDPGLIAPFLAATAGNPLAVRSALRGAIKSGSLVQEQGNGTWRVGLESAAFADTLDRNVRLLSEGMAVHLNDQERRIAEEIACLGEVVAQETVKALIPEGEAIIESLVFKGIVAPSGAQMPALHGAASTRQLLAFTHSLLHRRFAEAATIEIDRLLDLIASGLPLYSIVPFQLIDGRMGESSAPPDTVGDAVLRTLLVAQGLDRTSDWRLALPLWSIAEQMFDLLSPSLDEESRRATHAKLLNTKLQLLRRDTVSTEFERIANLFLAITEQPRDLEFVNRRVQALTHKFRWNFRRRREEDNREIWREVEELMKSFPDIRSGREYVEFLRNVAQGAGMSYDLDMLRIIRDRFEEIIGSPEVSAEVKARMHRVVFPHLLKCFDTPEELDRLKESIDRLEDEADPDDVELIWQISQFEMATGEVRSVLKRLEIVVPRFKERSLAHSYWHAFLLSLCCRASLGVELEQVERELLAAHEEIPEEVRIHFLLLSGDRLASVGALRGDAVWTKRIMTRYLLGADEVQSAKYRIMLLMATGGEQEDLLEISCDDDSGDLLCRLVDSLFREGADSDAAGKIARDILAAPIVRRDDILSRRAAIDLLIRAADGPFPGLQTELRGEIQAALKGSMEWLDERCLFPFMVAIVTRYRSFFSRGELAQWKVRIAELSAAHSVDRGNGGRSDRVKLTMLGTIEVQLPGEEPTRVRGQRLRTLLGLLVADRMLARPLGQREFTRLAAIDIPELDDARKTLHLSVHRVREIIGHEAIGTEGPTPRLNLDLVDVDLIEADRLLGEAERAMREGSFIRAVPSLIGALRISGAEIPFPTLFEEFFTAAREDFENRRRSLVLRVARGVLREADAAGAEELLQAALAAIPDDAEIASLLEGALIQLGKMAEAERIRMRAATAPEPV